MSNRRSRQRQIKQLRERNSFLSKKISLLEAQNDTLNSRLAEWASEIRSQLGDCSVFNEQVALISRRSEAPYIHISSLPKIEYERKTGVPVDNQTIIRAFIRSVNAKPDLYANQIRINLVAEDGTYSYAVSDEVRRSVRDDNYIAKMIAQQMGRHLR